MAACVAHAHLGLLGFGLALLHERAAAFLGQRRNGQAYHFAVVFGSDAEFGVDDGFLDFLSSAVVLAYEIFYD